MTFENKFRAWDPLRNKMWKYAVPMFEGKINVSDRENGTFNEIIKGELMQWTGLVDCKGNKIFIGDILATSNDGRDGADIWEEKLYGYNLVEEGKNHLGIAFSNWEVDHEPMSVYSLLFYVRVIGNRFQNPELIKE